MDIKDIYGKVIYSSKDKTIKKTLERAVSEKANLEFAYLKNTYLGHANLKFAYLENACLIYTNLHGANLTNANIGSADLHGANLTNANLENANLADINLESACLANANSYYFSVLKAKSLKGAIIWYGDVEEIEAIKEEYKSELALRGVEFRKF